MLPFLGPSNERDTLGFAADTAANPLIYIAPYEFVANDPLTWLGPYTYLAYMVMYNDLSDTVGEYVRNQAEMDPYSGIQYAGPSPEPGGGFGAGEPDEASLKPSIRLLYLQGSEFTGRGKTRSVLIPALAKVKVHVLVATGKSARGYIVRSWLASAGPAFLALAELVYATVSPPSSATLQLRVHGTRLDRRAARVSAGGRERCSRRVDGN
jgi:hypothetical protein